MLLRRAAILALLPLGLAACNGANFPGLPGLGRAAPEAPVAPTPATGQPPAVSPLDVPIEVEGARRTLGTANEQFVDVSAFTAQGSGWIAAVRGNNAAIARQGARATQVNVRRVDFGQGVEFVGSASDRPASINIRGTECRDGAGAAWPMTATVKLAGNTLTGCAAPTGKEPRGFASELPTIRPVAAVTAAPKAAPKKAAPKRAAAPAATETTPAPATPTTPAPTTPAPTAPTPATPTPTPTTPEPAAPATAPASTAPATPAPTTPAPATPAPATTPEPAAPATPATPTPATPTTPAAPVVVPPAN